MAKVQDYGKDTGIDIDSVLYFHAEHKYVDATYWCDDRKDYRKQTVQWSLRSILAAHPEFEQTHRGYLVRRSAILAVAERRALLATQNDTEIQVPISRRLVPHTRKIANANSTAA